jgi:phage N-6-adenine-methyltransferase
MSINKVFFSSMSNEWQTPKNVFEYLDNKYHFKLDAAATKENSLCNNYFTIENDALNQNWFNYNSIYCNPPYGRKIGKFVKKSYEESLKGAIVVLLIPARTDTKWWFEYCSKGNVKFIIGRLKFINKLSPSYKKDLSMKLSPAPFPSAIVIFGEDNTPSTTYITQNEFINNNGKLLK